MKFSIIKNIHFTIKSLLTLFIGIAVFSTSALGQVIPDGVYTAIINETPELLPDSKIPDVGTDGAWNTNFSLNALPNAASSQGSFDNNITLTVNGGPYGSSELGKGAGSWKMIVFGDVFVNQEYQQDAIEGTSMGNVVFSGTIGGGTIDQTTGEMTFTPNGRFATTDIFISIGDGIVPWWTENGTNNYFPFTTGIVTTNFGSITGAPVTNLGDIDGDGKDDFNVIFVSAGIVSDKTSFIVRGASYYETWNVNLVTAPVVVDPCLLR